MAILSTVSYIRAMSHKISLPCISSTILEHVPANHQMYSEWDKARFMKWVSGIGEATYKVIKGIFDSYRIEEQTYKGCLFILKLETNTLRKDWSMPAERCWNGFPAHIIKNIRLILESGNDKAVDPSNQSFKSIHDESYALVRGASYYGGGRHEK